MIALEQAYLRCDEITRSEAKNFAYGIRLLPDDKRNAMSALYAFARRVDDIGDGASSPADKLVELASVRETLEQTAAGSPPPDDAVLVALSDAMGRYSIDQATLAELVTGCELDCHQQRYETFEELSTYCRYVAGSIGRCSLAVFGSDDPAGPELSYTLGVALQLTNILRDVVEDREVMGRVYLPSEDLSRFSCSSDVHGSPDQLAALICFEAGRAQARYEDGLGLLDLLDRRSRACVAAMAGIYRRVLSRIEKEPLSVFERRVSLPVWEKAWVAARSLAGVQG